MRCKNDKNSIQSSISANTIMQEDFWHYYYKMSDYYSILGLVFMWSTVICSLSRDHIADITFMWPTRMCYLSRDHINGITCM